MERLRNLLRRAPADRRLLIQVALLILLVWSALRLLPYRTVRHLLTCTSRRRRHFALDADAARPLVRAVRLSARRLLPEGSCLAQALTLQWMFLRRGFSADVRIGVAKDRDGCLVAHAWIESDGHIVIGGRSSSERYSVLSGRQ